MTVILSDLRYGAAVVDALPLRPGLRVLEIGGAGGATARAVAEQFQPRPGEEQFDLAFAIRDGGFSLR